MRLTEVNNTGLVTATGPRDSLGSPDGRNKGSIIGKGTKEQPYLIGAGGRGKALDELNKIQDLQNGDWFLNERSGALISLRYYAPSNSLWRTDFLPSDWDINSTTAQDCTFKFEGGLPALDSGWSVTGDGTSGFSDPSSFIRSGDFEADVITFNANPPSIQDFGNFAYQIDRLQLVGTLNQGSASPSDADIRIEMWDSALDYSFPLIMANAGTYENVNANYKILNVETPIPSPYIPYSTNVDIVAEPVFLEVYMNISDNKMYVFKDYEPYPIAVYVKGPLTSPSVSPYPAFRLYAKTAADTVGWNQIDFQSIAGTAFYNF